jgi:hypothetical protein
MHGGHVSPEIERLQRYLEALETARRSLDEARKLRPDFGLDHALDRLRAMIAHGASLLSEQLMMEPDEDVPRRAARR